eukprot:ctg_2239.g526
MRSGCWRCCEAETQHRRECLGHLKMPTAHSMVYSAACAPIRGGAQMEKGIALEDGWNERRGASRVEGKSLSA